MKDFIECFLVALWIAVAIAAIFAPLVIAVLLNNAWHLAWYIIAFPFSVASFTVISD